VVELELTCATSRVGNGVLAFWGEMGVLWVHSLAALWVLLGFAFMMIDDTLCSEQSEQDHVQMILIRCFLDDLELQSQHFLSSVCWEST
jgi:hypothetical protein